MTFPKSVVRNFAPWSSINIIFCTMKVHFLGSMHAGYRWNWFAFSYFFCSFFFQMSNGAKAAEMLEVAKTEKRRKRSWKIKQITKQNIHKERLLFNLVIQAIPKTVIQMTMIYNFLKKSREYVAFVTFLFWQHK